MPSDTPSISGKLSCPVGPAMYNIITCNDCEQKFSANTAGNSGALTLLAVNQAHKVTDSY